MGNEMTGSTLFFRDKISVAILGATGCVGQKFVQMLSSHPWFDIKALCASERSIGKQYGDAVHWRHPTPLPEEIARLVVQPCHPVLPCSVVFSGLDSHVAGGIETAFAEQGCLVISNASNHRMDPYVPLVVGEVNPDHFALMDRQSFSSGRIVTNPNCSVTGLVLALKPLQERFGLHTIQVTTLQSLSGAGYPGVASLDVCDNVIPYIEGEEAKIEREPLKILGSIGEGGIENADIAISAQCNRVAVSEGHLACVSVKFHTKPSIEDLIEAWETFRGEPQELQLPTAPFQPIHYFEQPYYPQPRLHRSLDKGMAVSIGHLRRCKVMDYKFTLLSHNTVRGAVGAALLNAELLLAKGKIFW
jgi:aspartate-semialdehyde dehydrogenase